MATPVIAPRAYTPGVIWLTGLSGAGKSTLSSALAQALGADGYGPVTLLDGEEVRRRLPHRYGHSLKDRAQVARHVIDLAEAELTAGNIVIVASISHQLWMRQTARTRLGRFLEVYLDCPAQTCAARDVKGHYARAYRGEEACFIGVTHDYEYSEKPDLTLSTGTQSIASCQAELRARAREFLNNS